MDYLGWILFAVAVIIVVVALMGLGWRNRLRRQGDVPSPAEVPADLGRVQYEAEGQYVATTTAGDWLDRIAVHGLGIRGNAVSTVHPEGVLITRTGARTVFVPREDLVAVQLASGMTGKFVEKEGLVILTWNLGTERVDTGFRTRHASAKTQLVAAAAALIPAAPPDRRAPDQRTPDQRAPDHRTAPNPEGREEL